MNTNLSLGSRALGRRTLDLHSVGSHAVGNRAVAASSSLAMLVALAACHGVRGDANRVATELVRQDGRIVANLVHAPYDASTPATAAATGKPWHDVFAGEGRVLTKGPGGTFPHHRGLFVGWNQVQCGGERFDFWHLNHGESQRLVRMLADANGRQQTATIDWCKADGTVVVHEQRTMTLHERDDGAAVLDVQIELAAASDDVVLSGDPQHAGHQFRAVQAFAEKGAVPVRYLRPATAKGGKDDVWTDCAWTAAVLPFADGSVTVLRVEGTGNPTATWSTRPYGRFGAMWRLRLPRGAAPTTLRVAWVIADGERDAVWCEAFALSARE